LKCSCEPQAGTHVPFMNWFYRVNGQVITRAEHVLCIQ
jgi:hypothetical protein